MSRDEDPDKGFSQFERFLDEWSRRDFLKRTGGAAAYLAFMAGGAEWLAACGPGTTGVPPKKDGRDRHRSRRPRPVRRPQDDRQRDHERVPGSYLHVLRLQPRPLQVRGQAVRT